MGYLLSLLKSLYNCRSRRKVLNEEEEGEDSGKNATAAFLKEAMKNDLMLESSGFINGRGSNSFVSVFSKRGEKGVNQDCSIVWEEFGYQEDMIFCGLFDGHGHWGHYVAKKVRESLPSSLLCKWQEVVAQASIDVKNMRKFGIWKESYMRACTAIDEELQRQRKMDSFNSGTTALTVVRQLLVMNCSIDEGDLIVLANVGDSRAVLATTSDDGSLVAVQLTVDFKPNLPQEAERIIRCKGRVFCLNDEPGVHRVWLPNEETPGLAMSRAFGDYCVKDFGLISEPEVARRTLTNKDQFIVLATDGVWEVISNEEAVQIVSSAKDKEKSAKQLVEFAVKAWRRKRRGIAVDDCSAICLFFSSHSDDDPFIASSRSIEETKLA